MAELLCQQRRQRFQKRLTRTRIDPITGLVVKMLTTTTASHPQLLHRRLDIDYDLKTVVKDQIENVAGTIDVNIVARLFDSRLDSL